MPISTLLPKSMPWTNSRKPCTKCWRDISPSQTMSMPASSCILTASRVASSLPCARSAPSSRHFGQSLSGSASQDGFGKLPATVAGNMEVSSGIFFGPDRSLWQGLLVYLPIIEPVVALEQSFSAQQFHAEIAHQHRGSGLPIKLALLARDMLGASCTTGALSLISAQALRQIGGIGFQTSRQHGAVLDRHAGALRQKRQHRMGGVPDHADGAFAAAERCGAIV